MQITCTLLQTDNHSSTSSVSSLQAGCSFWYPIKCQRTEGNWNVWANGEENQVRIGYPSFTSKMFMKVEMVVSLLTVGVQCELFTSGGCVDWSLVLQWPVSCSDIVTCNSTKKFAVIFRLFKNNATVSVCSVLLYFLLLIIMVALCNRADHYVFILWFLLSFFLFILA